MSSGYRIRVFGRVDGAQILDRMQPLSLPAVALPERDALIELQTASGAWERDGIGTTIAVECAKEGDEAAQYRTFMSAVDRFISSGDEDFAVGYYDRLVIRRVNGVVERFDLDGRPAVAA